MKKNWFFLVASLVCIVVSVFALTYAWYIGGNSQVAGGLTGFEAVSPEDIAIDIDDSQVVDYPVKEIDGLIPCSPIGASIDAISNEEWFIPSFLPSERGRRCCYAFDITVYSSAGFTGTKRIALTFDPKPKDKSDNASLELVKYIQCAAILLKGNEIGVNQLIAHTDYSIYDEESDYYIKAGRQMDDFYYEFNRHTATVEEDKLNQKIRVLVWIDGFVPDYSAVAGGEALLDISIQDKTPGSSDTPPVVGEHIVTFNLNDGSGATYASLRTEGSKLTNLPAAPIRKGYTFDGWFDAETGGNEVTTNTTFIDNTTVYAHWTKGTVAPIEQHSVTFKDGDKTVATKTVAHGETITDIPTRSKTGYTFDGWFTETGGTKLETSTPINADVTYVARWTINSYTVTFKNGETIVETVQNVEHNSKLTSIPNAPTNTGYTFDGWFDAETGGNEVTTDTAITDNMTVYAHWTINKYTVTYYDGENVIYTEYNVKHGTHTLYSPVAKEGYTFNGWLLNNEGNLYNGGLTYEIESDTKFYGKWTKNSYEVTFNVDGGSAVNAQIIEHGGKVIKPADPTKTGYTFDGWYKDTALTETFDFNIAITDNTTIFAKWTEGSVTPPATTTTTFDFDTNSTGWTAKKTSGNITPTLTTKASGSTDKYLRIASGGKTTVSLQSSASYTDITSISVEVGEFSSNKDVVFTLYVVGTDGKKSEALATVTESATATTWNYVTLTYNGTALSGYVLIEATTPSGRYIGIDNVVITHAA